MTAEGVSQSGGRRGSKQRDSVGREDAGFVNTGRKERKQVGERVSGESEEKEWEAGVKPGRRWECEAGQEGEHRKRRKGGRNKMTV